MQLVYHWNLGIHLLQTAITQVHQFLTDPKRYGVEEETLLRFPMPLKKQKIEEAKKNADQCVEFPLVLDQSIEILEVVLNDLIEETSAYQEDVLTQLIELLKEVMPSLRLYLIAFFNEETPRQPQIVLESYYRLVSLSMHLEMYMNTKTTLEHSKHLQDDGDTLFDSKRNPLLGALPDSMIELQSILSNGSLPLNECGIRMIPV